MPDAPFEAIPRGSLEQEPIPLNGKRPLSQHPSAVRARAARAKAKTKGGARRRPTTRRKPISLAPEIGAFLTLVNGIIVVSPLGTRPIDAITDPTIPTTRVGDELDGVEINALATSIDAQCRRSPRFRKYVEMVLGAGSGGTLVTVVALIAARRLARHGVLPENIDAMAGMVMAADVGALADLGATPTETTDPDTGETVPDRGADLDG